MTTADRAMIEAGGYVWFPSKNPDSVFCLSQSGAVYEVSEEGCTCPSFTIHHTDCKHMICLRDRNARLKSA